MSTPAKHPIPEGMRSLTPHLICKDALSAMAFYTQAFGAVELARLIGPEGTLMHGLLKVGDSNLMLMEANPQWGALDPTLLKGSPVSIHFYVEDVDASYDRAMQAGATPVMAPAEMFWGDRYGVVDDPFGHRWSLATHTREMTQQEIEAGMKASNCGQPGD